MSPNAEPRGWATMAYKTFDKGKTAGQTRAFEIGTALPGPSQA